MPEIMTTSPIRSTGLFDHESYFLYQVANASVRDWPWTHVVFDQIFSPQQYAEILQNLPDIECLTDITKVHNNPGAYPVNKRFILLDYTKLPPQQQKFWLDMQRQFLNGKLKDIIVKKFFNHIQQRLGEINLSKTHFFDTFELTQDVAGYELVPHPDAFAKIFSIVINLPADNSNLNMGTTIYSAARDIIYQCPYARNTAFGIFRSDTSWHGVEPTTADRWTIQYTVWGRDRT